MSTAAEMSYLDYVQPQGAGGELTQLQKLAEQQASKQAEVAKLEAQLNQAKEELKALAEGQIPELMDQIGIANFKTVSGLVIEVTEKIRAAIPKPKAHLAFAWLKQHGHAALIRRTVSVAFGKGEDEKAEALKDQLASDYEVEDNANVHPSTLSAFVREKLQSGEEIPLDLFGVHRQRVAEIKA